MRPHGLGGGGEEMRAILPVQLRVRAEAEPRLVNERGGLQRVAGRIVRHFLRRDLPQLGVNQLE